MIVNPGSTDVTTYFVLRSSTDGTELTGATITNIDLQYTRSGVAPTAKVDATALAATDSAHGDNQAIEIDATDQPGLYRVDWPDAAFAAGVREVILTVKYSGAFTEHLRVELGPPVNVELWNNTAVPSEHTAGYPIVTIKDGTGTGEINTNGGAIALVDLVTTTTTVTNQLTAAQIATGVWQDATAGDFTAASSIGKCLYIANVAPGAAGGHFIAGSNAATTVASFTSSGALTVNEIICTANFTLDGLVVVGAASIGGTMTFTGAVSATHASNDIRVNTVAVGGNSTVATNLIVVYATDFATNYNTTLDRWSVNTATIDGDTDTTFIAAVADAVWDEAAAGHVAAGSFGVQCGTDIDAILADTGTDGVVVAAGSKTGYALSSTGMDSVTLPASIITATSIASNAFTDAKFNSDAFAKVYTSSMTEAYGTDGSALTLAQGVYLLVAHMGEHGIASTTKTLKKLDGSTTAAVFTLDSATTPTSITRSS